MRKIYLITVTVLLCLILPACQANNIEIDSTGEHTAVKIDSMMETPDANDPVIGQWKMTGVIYDGTIVFLKDNPELNELYKHHWITIKEDGTYFWQEKAIINQGIWLHLDIQDDKNFYLFKQKNYTFYNMENGAVKEIVQPCNTQYILHLLEEDSAFLLYEEDDIDFPYIFQRDKNPGEGSYNPKDQHSTSESLPNDGFSSESTAGERNALKKAKSYLDYSAFSYTGLIEQLEYEGFTHSEAKYGADHCGANWDEQALKKARTYLHYSAFSYQGLIEQLEYEGFTHSQAVYAAEIAYEE